MLVKDKDLTGPLLVKEIRSIINDAERLRNMSLASKRLGRAGALNDIIDCVEKILPRH
ncbi:hypothetical protein N752_09035 [Desulforamulus aquiferis]|nr:hypothetical protein N752_09035 [Desulforamulus aquiferis]